MSFNRVTLRIYLERLKLKWKIANKILWSMTQEKHAVWIMQKLPAHVCMSMIVIFIFCASDPKNLLLLAFRLILVAKKWLTHAFAI